MLIMRALTFHVKGHSQDLHTILVMDLGDSGAQGGAAFSDAPIVPLRPRWRAADALELSSRRAVFEGLVFLHSLLSS